MAEWLRLATSHSVVRRALAVACVVGSILAAINHGPAMLRGEMTWGRTLQIALTALVPYCVSTFSSVNALLERERRERRDSPIS